MDYKPLLAGITLLFSSLATAETTVNYYVVEDLSAPFQIATKGQSEGGIITDILTTALQNSDYKIEIKVLPVNRLHVEIRKDTGPWVTYDAKVWNSLLDVGEFVTPSLFTVKHDFLTCKARSTVFDDASLHGNTIAILNSFQYPALAAKQEALQITMMPVSSYQQGINLVQLERIDGFVEMDIRLRYNTRTLPSLSNCLNFMDFSEVIAPFDIFFSLNKDADPLLRELLTHRITEMKASGQIEKIIESYVAAP